MAFVVTKACINCKYTNCVDVCPMSCLYEGPNFLVIDPDDCIDCSVCVPECPVARLAKDPAWQRIARSKAPLARNGSDIKP